MHVIEAISQGADPPGFILSRAEIAPIVLAAIIRAIEDGEHEKATAALNRLLPGFMARVEYMMIVDAGKNVIESGRPLEFDALTEELAKMDRANFARISLEGLRDVPIPDGFSLENGVEKLVAANGLSLKDKSSAASLARDILNQRIRLRDAAGQLVAIGAFWPADKGQLFAKLGTFLSEVQDFPVGKAREHWNKAAFARKDEELRAIEARTMSEITPQLETLGSEDGNVAVYGPVAPPKRWWQVWK